MNSFEAFLERQNEIKRLIEIIKSLGEPINEELRKKIGTLNRAVVVLLCSHIEGYIEDSIIEMLEPKVKEIQNRFSKGEKLGLQDFNLLLLKTQYNHLNHLDHKLDEVVTDVANLRMDFKGLENKFTILESKFTTLEGKYSMFEKNIELKLESFKNDIEYKIQKAINVNMRWSIGIIAFIVTALKIIDMIFK